MDYEPSWQARFLDPARALGKPRALHGDGGSVLVHLRDAVFPDLCGDFVWTISEETPGWHPAGPGEGSDLPAVRLSMGELSRIWYGGADVYALLSAGRVECDERAARLLHAAFGGFGCHMQVGF
jgi:hypothetical protein